MVFLKAELLGSMLYDAVGKRIRATLIKKEKDNFDILIWL